MGSSYYKYCIVPQCKNTSIKTPDKLFIYVPNNQPIRKKWLTLARRSDAHCLSISSNRRMYFCEDHFDLPNDMKNYMEYHIMGSVSQIRMKPGCVPSKFSCQAVKGKHGTTKKRPNILRKKEMKAAEESLNASNDSSTESADDTIAKDLYEDTSHESSRDQSKEKWESLRSVFVRDSKNYQSKKKSYYLSDYRQLTVPYIECQNSPENMSYVHQAVMDEEDTRDDPLSCPDSSENMDRKHLSTSCSATTPPSNIPTSPMSSPTSPQSCQSDEPHRNSNKKRKSQGDLNQMVIEYFNAKKAKLIHKATDLTEDHRKMFLLSLLPDVKIMSDAQMRDFKRKVLALVDEILQETSRDPVQSSPLYECKQELRFNDNDRE